MTRQRRITLELRTLEFLDAVDSDDSERLHAFYRLSLLHEEGDWAAILNQLVQGLFEDEGRVFIFESKRSDS